MNFEFATAGRIVFGAGSLHEVGPAAAQLAATRHGQDVLIVTGRPPGFVGLLSDELKSAGLRSSIFEVKTEPTVALIAAGVQRARETHAAVVIGFGGGSSIDAAKAIAALATNDGEITDYLEVIGQGKKIASPPLSTIAIPTTAGTGAEVTRNAVLSSPEHRVKVSLRSPMMLPNVAIIDPELTYDLPPAVTAATGLDALTQLIEALVCTRGNPITHALCWEGVHRVHRALPRVYRNGQDAAAREDMALASLFGGLGLANAGLGAVHGFAGPIGGMFAAPHGAICAALLPHVMAVNIRALKQRQPGSRALGHYMMVASILNDQKSNNADAAIAHLRQLCTDLGIPSLKAYGLSTADIPAVVEKAKAASSMKANPIVLTTEELTEVLENAI